MITIDDLVFAIDETQKTQPNNTFKAVYASIISKVPGSLTYITTKNKARQRIQDSNIIDILRIIALEIAKIYNYSAVIRRTDPEYANQTTFKKQYEVLIRKCPGYEMVNALTRVFKDEKVNSIGFLLTDNKALTDALHIIDRYYYSYDQQYRTILQKYGLNKVSDVDITSLVDKIEKDAAKMMPVSNVHINSRAVNRCYNEVIRGLQVRNSFNDYALGGNLFATQHIGKYRHNQQDSVIIMEHPQNPEFKLLVVSDGMGGGISGEDVSTYTCRNIAKWFESVNPDMYNNPAELQYLFNCEIDRISKDMYKKYNSDTVIRAGATFTGAIVTKDQTIITQIGDSRAYIIKNGSILRREKISLVTRDESRVWPKDENLRPKDPSELSQAEIEDTKYALRSNEIFRCIGHENVGAYEQSFIIPNSSYDKLLLMSDGASDLLSFEGIKIICRNTPWDKITKLLVEASLKKTAIRGKEWDEFYKKLVEGTVDEKELEAYNKQAGNEDANHRGFIAAGKDNTTVAGYFRR